MRLFVSETGHLCYAHCDATDGRDRAVIDCYLYRKAKLSALAFVLASWRLHLSDAPLAARE